MNNNAINRVLAREAAVKAWLKGICEIKGVRLPIEPEAVYEALGNINTAEAKHEFAPVIEDLEEYVNKNKVEALVYEWYYDGREVRDIYVEESYAYQNCEFEDSPAGTDLIKIPGNDGFEMDPKFDKMVKDTYAGFCLDPVMNAYYEGLSTIYRAKFDEYYTLNDEAGIDIDLDEVNYAYEELFHLKLVALIREAYLEALAQHPINITTGRPLHIFISRHERWPLHVLSMNI